ncbi:ATP-grasp domain-containing protein [Lactococcus lactis subsp. lactis]|uniref:ATP-grasp domain-containing protein n=1 Tax=Lactococcus lactis TaxID=1358 RepID=UPI0021AF6A53|nr:ATP-grasp domain-containing protein [Lactococcus lactis]MCT0017725.1 ATP-grasp domain-containing protein [Lactococcus lactis subsp. lactis]
MKILFTGGRAPATLEMVRNFGENGWEVFIAESIRLNMSSYSKYVKSSFIISSPGHNEKKFVTELIQIINENKIDILFPTCEEIFWVSKNKEIISDSCNTRIVCDKLDSLSLLHNKYRFIKFAENLDILTPKTELLFEERDIIRKSVIKPIFSRFGTSVQIINPKEKINNDITASYVVQEFIKGKSICSYGFAEKGQLKFNICYKSPFNTQQALTAFIPFSSNEVNHIVRKVVERLEFTGNISFDFIQKDGRFYLIECNPRLTSGIHVLSLNNFITLFFGKNKEKLLNRAQLMIPTLRYGRILCYRDIIFSVKDMKPFFKQFSCLKIFYKVKKQQHISLIEAMTEDIEWNGEGDDIAKFQK